MGIGKLGHYVIIKKLGEGGMGQVLLAEDPRLKRRVALKVLPEALANDPARLQRFQREAELVAGLNHPNIVTLYNFEESEGVQRKSTLESNVIPTVMQHRRSPEMTDEAENTHRSACPRNARTLVAAQRADLSPRVFTATM